MQENLFYPSLWHKWAIVFKLFVNLTTDVVFEEIIEERIQENITDAKLARNSHYNYLL